MEIQCSKYKRINRKFWLPLGGNTIYPVAEFRLGFKREKQTRAKHLVSYAVISGATECFDDDGTRSRGWNSA